MTGIAVGPLDIPKVISYSCKLKWEDRCFCVKVGSNCSDLCKECQGVSCTNASAAEDNSDDHKSI